MMWTPRISPYCLVRYHLDESFVAARGLWPGCCATNGNLPTLTLRPAACACASVIPRCRCPARYRWRPECDCLLMGRTGLPAMCATAIMPFAGRHVRQLWRARHDVADRVDARLAGLLILVHFDEAAIELDLGILEPDAAPCSACVLPRPAASPLRSLLSCRLDASEPSSRPVRGFGCSRLARRSRRESPPS